MDDNQENICEILKNELKKQLDKEYEKYISEQLKDYHLILEEQRNKILTSLIDSVSITMEKDFGTHLPAINIRIEKRIMLKEEE